MKSKILLLVLLAFILIPALFFPYPVHIQNVLADKPAEQFTVAISPWRILLEPIVGPMLFYLRADQPMLEIGVLLVWAMAALLLLSLIRQAKSNGVRLSSLLRALLRWSARLPILIILWIALLAIIIFAPLPNNSIVNNNPDVLLLNTHSHTEWSHDGLISQEKLMRWHAHNGFDAFFITDHNNHAKSLEFVAKQKNGEIPAQPLVLCGEEFSGSNHITLLGLQRDFRTRGMADSTAIDSAQANGGVAIVAHWFADEHKTIQHYIDIGADGFEIVNQAEGLQYDRRIYEDIVSHCRQNGMLMLAACDYHGYGSAALAWNAFHIPEYKQMRPEQKRHAIMNILRRHQQDNIQVLMYRDRPLFPRRLVGWSPIFNIVNYYRTLNVWQVLSWAAWLAFFVISLGSIKKGTTHRPVNRVRVFGLLGATAAVFILMKGLQLLSKTAAVNGFNNIYKEFGQQFFWIGVIFLAYSLVYSLLPLSKKK